MPIMSPQLIKNFFSGPATRAYPFEKRPVYPQSRGRIVYDAKKCRYCGICAEICPAGAITVEEDRENIVMKRTFDSFACIYCGRCIELCPNNALSMDVNHPESATAKELLVTTGK